MHNWRVDRLTRLGVPESLAEVYADRLDWHQVARLVQRGCPRGWPCASPCDERGESPYGADGIAPTTRELVDTEARRIIEECYEQSLAMLRGGTRQVPDKAGCAQTPFCACTRPEATASASAAWSRSV